MHFIFPPHARECTRVHNAQATWTDLWCTSSELKAPSDYSEYAKTIKNTDKGLFTKNKCTAGVMENAGVKCYAG